MFVGYPIHIPESPWYLPWLPPIPIHQDPESPAPNASRDVFTKPLVTKASISRVRLKACEGTCAGKMCGSDWKWETSGLIVEKGGTIKLHQNRWMLRLRLPEAAGKKQERPTVSGSTGFLMDLMAEMKSRFNQVSNWPDSRRVSKSSATIKANICKHCTYICPSSKNAFGNESSVSNLAI